MCIPKSNHRNLVDTCYPAAKALPNIGPEYRPNSNELSRLAYYASNKPAKLLKVGEYLDSKVKVWSKTVASSAGAKGSEGAKGALMVSLTIAKTLVVECKQSLNYLLPSVSSILLSALAAAAKGAPGGKLDLDIAARTASTFYAVATFTDPQLTNLDTSSRSNYNDILKKLAGLSQGGVAAQLDAEDANKARLIGLGALSGVVSGDLLYQGGSFGQQLNLIIPALLANLTPNTSNSDAPVDVAFLQEESHRAVQGTLTYNNFRIKRQPLAARKAPSIYDGGANGAVGHQDGEKGPTRRDVASAATGVLQALVSHADGNQLQIIVSHVLDYLDKSIGGSGRTNLWNDGQWCNWLGLTLTEWAAVQYRFIIVSSLSDHLIEVCDSGKPTTQSSSLISTIKVILTSSFSLIGLSTSDMVNNLLGLSVRRVHEDLDDPLLPDLVDTVGALGQHVYYAEQMSDIAEEICARIEMLQMPDEQHQEAALLFTPGAGLNNFVYNGRKSVVGDNQPKRTNKGAPLRKVGASTAQQKDESIRVLLYCLITSLRKAHESASKDKSTSAKSAKGGLKLDGGARDKIEIGTLRGVSGLLSWPSAVARLPFQQTLALFLNLEVPSKDLIHELPSVVRTDADKNIGTLHALAASIYVTALSRALFVPENLKQHPLEALPTIDRINADVAKPVRPDAIASANPVDYNAIEQILTSIVSKLPVLASFAFVPMLIKLEKDAVLRLKLVQGSQGGVEAQRLYATKRVVAAVYSTLGAQLGISSFESVGKKALSSLPKSDLKLTQAPARLMPPENVYQFRDGPAPSGFDVTKLFPVVGDSKSIVQALASNDTLMRVTGLSTAELTNWFSRDWNVTIAVDDSFISASPFTEDLPPENILRPTTPARRGSVGYVGGAVNGGTLVANTYTPGLGRNAGNDTLTVGDASMLSVPRTDAGSVSINGRANTSATGIQDLRDALQTRSVLLPGSAGTTGTATTNGSAGSAATTPDRRASKRMSRRAVTTSTSGSVPPLPESSSVGGILDSLHIASGNGSATPGKPTGAAASTPVVPPYAA